jgi:lysozyme
MHIGDFGIALIKSCEGMKLDAYQDTGGVWTIGYGHTLGVKKGDTITPGEAERLLVEDIGRHDITPLLNGCPTKQTQFDAMTSLAFNIGMERFRNSTVLKRHKLQNYLGAANAFLLWVYDDGRREPGLVKRRELERKLYLAP